MQKERGHIYAKAGCKFFLPRIWSSEVSFESSRLVHFKSSFSETTETKNLKKIHEVATVQSLDFEISYISTPA